MVRIPDLLASKTTVFEDEDAAGGSSMAAQAAHRPHDTWSEGSYNLFLGWNKRQWLAAVMLYGRAKKLEPPITAECGENRFFDTQCWWRETYCDDPYVGAMKVLPDFSKRDDYVHTIARRAIDQQFRWQKHDRWIKPRGLL